ncbi:hypothetical protein [Xanthomonas hortorum]|uniref:Uncharacterized protein n=1 Tax=Xanthomonas hortorum TaxID=56454 RepID=A0AA47EXS8_9XANT|nr:hypothetical protein [Xanthomonas hortorum]WAH66075.1 hypothetical protein OEG85_09105 [Xanthomonas hortorum]
MSATGKHATLNLLVVALRDAVPDLHYMPQHREAVAAAARVLAPQADAVVLDVIHRSQVGACIPFTVLPKHYHGKRVRIVIAEGSDE